MAFEKFIGAGRSFSPKATISRHGTFSFNEGACARFKVKEYDAVVLWYDADNGRIGVQLVTDLREEGAIKLRKRDMGADFSAVKFLDRYDERPDHTTTFPIARDAETEFLVIDLATGVERGSLSRKRSEFRSESS